MVHSATPTRTTSEKDRSTQHDHQPLDPTGKKRTILTPPSTIHLPEDRNIERQIAKARTTAVKDKVRVLIERTTKRGTRIPVLEITPQGDIREVPAPALRVSLRERMNHLFTEPNLRPNNRATAGYTHISMMVAESDRRIAVKKGRNQGRRDRQSQRATPPELVAQ